MKSGKAARSGKLTFAQLGADVSLDEIARRADLGIGTLYRHFPTRVAVVEALYRREVTQLAEAAARLLDTMRPGAALYVTAGRSVGVRNTRQRSAGALVRSYQIER